MFIFPNRCNSAWFSLPAHLFPPLTLFQSQHSSWQPLFLCLFSPHHPQLLSSLVTSPTWFLSPRYLVLLWVPFCEIATMHVNQHVLGSGRTKLARLCHLGPPLLLSPQGRKGPGKAMQNCLDANSSSAIPGFGIANMISSNLYHVLYSYLRQKHWEKFDFFFFIALN